MQFIQNERDKRITHLTHNIFAVTYKVKWSVSTSVVARRTDVRTYVTLKIAYTINL